MAGSFRANMSEKKSMQCERANAPRLRILRASGSASSRLSNARLRKMFGLGLRAVGGMRKYHRSAKSRNCLMKSPPRSEEHTSELQSQSNLVCRLLLEKKKQPESIITATARTR